MMMLKASSIDNFCHWHYTLEGDGAIIDILGLNVRTEVKLYERPGVEEAGWFALESQLRQEFVAYREQMKRVEETFERWHLFINPYRRLHSIVERFVARLQEIDIANASIPTLPKTPDRFPLYAEELKHAQEKYREAMALSTSLQMVAPVLGEAAINLVMLLLARPEVKGDRRLYEDFTRRNIDVRVKSLHLCCIGFARPIDGSEEPFKDFLRLMNRRNDVLHGNVDPMLSTGDEIFFDHGNIPLVPRYRTLAESALANALANAKPDDSLRDVKAAKDFVDFLVSRLESDVQPIVRRALEEEQLGYRPMVGQIGVILPAVLMDMLKGPAENVSPGTDDEGCDGITSR